MRAIAGLLAALLAVTGCGLTRFSSPEKKSGGNPIKRDPSAEHFPGSQNGIETDGSGANSQGQSPSGNSGGSGSADGNGSSTLTVGPDQNIWFPSSGGTDQGRFQAATGALTRLEGEIALPATLPWANLDVQFIVDITGSMAQNDPQCARRDAIAKIVETLKATIPTLEGVRGTLTIFNEWAVTPIPLGPLSGLQSHPDFSRVCTFAFNTNYAVGIDEAGKAWSGQDASRHRVSYLISDGLPTAPSKSEGATLGLEAAGRFRSIPGLSFFAVFLGGDGDVEYLNALTANPARVRVATNANELADKLLSLGSPLSVNLEASHVSLALSAPGFPVQYLNLETLMPHPSKPHTWIFKTQPFSPFVKGAEQVVNTVTVGVNHPALPPQKAEHTYVFSAIH